MATPKLSKAGVQLREQFDDSFGTRSRASDGWIGDARHQNQKSDHNPDLEGWVRALDITAKLEDRGSDLMWDVVDQLRKAARKDGRLAYIIYDGKIASPKSLWRWRKYTGANPHRAHAHFSFKKSADNNRKFWNVPLLGGE